MSDLDCGHQQMVCSHCGRADMVYALWEYPAVRRLFYRVCVSSKDGEIASPYCYQLVATGVETIGQRKWNIAL